MGESGAEALFIRHIDPQDRDMRLKTQHMEFVWRPDFYHSGARDQIFTHIIYDFDMSPFDLVFDSAPFQPEQEEDTNTDTDDGSTTDSEDSETPDDSTEQPALSKKLKQSPLDTGIETQGLVEYINEVARYYQTNHILMFVGTKENFEDSDEVFYQLDNLIMTFDRDNTNNITLTYSTLSTYDETLQAYNLDWPTNYFDFVPSTDNNIRYFTGLYSSRPEVKSLIRYASRTLHANNKLMAMKMLDPATTDAQIGQYQNASRTLAETIAEAQNSDGVAGTAHKMRVDQIVADLYTAIGVNKNATAQIVNDAIMRYAGLEHKRDSWHWCSQQLSSYMDCQDSTPASIPTNNIVVSVFNPATLPINYTKVAVSHGNYSV